MDGLERAVVDHVGANEERLFETLRTLVRFRTPNPPGGNEAEVQAFLAGRLGELGLRVDSWDVLPGRPNVIGVLAGRGGGSRVVLNAHVDVCEERGLERWSSDPYEPVTAGRTMVGRGTTDVKSAFASFLGALEALRACGVGLRGEVVVQCVVGEEAGEPGTRAAIERGYGGDFALVGEASCGRDLVACIGVVNCRIVVESPETLHLAAKRLTTVPDAGLRGASCLEKLGLCIFPALAVLSSASGLW